VVDVTLPARLPTIGRRRVAGALAVDQQTIINSAESGSGAWFVAVDHLQPVMKDGSWVS
jgi:hypothetical protein